MNSKLIADKNARVLACDVWVPDLFDGRAVLKPSLLLPIHTTFRSAYVQTGQHAGVVVFRPSWSLAIVGQALLLRSHYLEYSDCLPYTFKSFLVLPRYTSSQVDPVSLTHSLLVHQECPRAERIPQAWRRCGVSMLSVWMHRNTYRVLSIAVRLVP